jgi:hypothetical protein
LLLGAFAIVQTKPPTTRRWPLFALPALCLAMSMDEVAQIHEWLGTKSDALFANGTRRGSLVSETGIWMFLLGPPFLIVVALLWRAFVPFLRGRERVVRLYVVGFVVYVVSALGIEFLANFVRHGGLAAVVQVVCEELGEMLGVTLQIWATLELLDSYDIHVCAGDRRAA